MHPYIRACQALESAGVPYVMVGAFGVNIYAERAGTVVTTNDCDLLLPPDPIVLRKAVIALRRLKYRLEAGDEPVDGDPDLMAGIVRALAVVRGVHGPFQIDLPLQIAGFDFQTLWKRQRRFKVQGAVVRVAPLADIIRSKELADRDKDRKFLSKYMHALKELLEPPKLRLRSSSRRTGRSRRKKK